MLSFTGTLTGCRGLASRADSTVQRHPPPPPRSDHSITVTSKRPPGSGVLTHSSCPMALCLLPHRTQIHWGPQLQGRGYQCTAVGTKIHMWSRALLAGVHSLSGLALSCLCGAGFPAPEKTWLGIRGGCIARARDSGDELKHSISMHRSHTVSLEQGITIQTQLPTMLGHWGLPVPSAQGNTTPPTPLSCPSSAQGGIFHSLMEVG